jgi:hypothetical protein
MRKRIFATVLCILGAGFSASTPAQTQSYAGQQGRAIKALSDDEVNAYLSGAGSGFARAAELNSYPGPMHALELADGLALTAAQRDALAALMARHKADARTLGAEVVRLERDLDALFAERRATPDAVDVRLAALGAAQARYRGAHLKTHIATTALLDAAQMAKYDSFRGYTAVPASTAPRHGGHGGHGH